MSTATRTVDVDVLDVLARSTLADNRLVLPEQLDRKAYTAVNKIIDKVGGKWDRRAGAHLFPGDAAEALEPVLLTGTVTDVRKQFDVFYTPADIAEQVIDLANIERGMSVLEPSAGMGALAIPAAEFGAEVHAYELRDLTWTEGVTPTAPDDPSGVTYRTIDSYRDGHITLSTGVDFLTVDPEPAFDAAIMNPPFSNQQDMAHVLHAARFVDSGGRLVAVMSPAFQFRSTRIAEQFRAWLNGHDHDITRLPEGAFKPAGTGVRTVLLAVNL